VSEPLITTRENFDRLVSKLRSQTDDDRARLAVLALSVPVRLQGVQITKQCLVPIGSFN
jgi:hypothetical protein